MVTHRWGAASTQSSSSFASRWEIQFSEAPESISAVLCVHPALPLILTGTVRHFELPVALEWLSRVALMSTEPCFLTSAACLGAAPDTRPSNAPFLGRICKRRSSCLGPLAAQLLFWGVCFARRGSSSRQREEAAARGERIQRAPLSLWSPSTVSCPPDAVAAQTVRPVESSGLPPGRACPSTRVGSWRGA